MATGVRAGFTTAATSTGVKRALQQISLFDTRPFQCKEGNVETHWLSSGTISSWITLLKKNKHFAPQTW